MAATTSAAAIELGRHHRDRQWPPSPSCYKGPPPSSPTARTSPSSSTMAATTSAVAIELGRHHQARQWPPPPRPWPSSSDVTIELDNGRHHLGRRHRACSRSSRRRAAFELGHRHRARPHHRAAGEHRLGLGNGCVADTTGATTIALGPCHRVTSGRRHRATMAATTSAAANRAPWHLRARQWPCCRHHQGPPSSSSTPASTRASWATLQAWSRHLPEDLEAPEGTIPSKNVRCTRPDAGGYASIRPTTSPDHEEGDDAIEVGFLRHFFMSSPSPSPPPLTTITVRNAQAAHFRALRWDSSPSMTNRTQTTKTVTFASVSP